VDELGQVSNLLSTMSDVGLVIALLGFLTILTLVIFLLARMFVKPLSRIADSVHEGTQTNNKVAATQIEVNQKLLEGLEDHREISEEALNDIADQLYENLPPFGVIVYDGRTKKLLAISSMAAQIFGRSAEDVAAIVQTTRLDGPPILYPDGRALEPENHPFLAILSGLRISSDWQLFQIWSTQKNKYVWVLSQVVGSFVEGELDTVTVFVKNPGEVVRFSS